MMFTMQVRFLSCIILSACHGFLLTNKTGTPSVGTNGLTDGHYIILTDALTVQKQLLTQMESFVLNLQNQFNTVNQEVKDLKSGKSATVAALKNESATQSLAFAALQNICNVQSLAVSGLKNETSELREQNIRMQKRFDSLTKKFDTLQNDNNVLKNDNAALKIQVSGWKNFSVHIKQELYSFTHSISASNIQNVTSIQSSVDTLKSQVKSLNTQFYSLSSTSTSRGQDFLALLNKTNVADLKLKTIDSWSKSYQNHTNDQLIQLQSSANYSLHRLDSLEQNYALVSNDIRNVKRQVQEMNQPVALTSCTSSSIDYKDGEIMKFPSTKTSIGMSNVGQFRTSGKFTCEKSGIYLFSVNIAYNGGATADFEMKKNSQLISRVMIVHASGHSSGTRFSGSGTVVVQINAGDVLFANAWRNMLLYDIDSCFTVIKIK